ncbi:alpha/beta hydrolase [Burkholderia sp. WAC0059]|nr:alpha/beta hydrolase [Burkholderia sp. WAC0059]
MLSVLACGLLASGCAPLDRNAHADALAKPAGLEREQIAADGFVLTAFTRITRPDAPLDLYIEGDGLAWVSRSEPSLDPTPLAATGLALAAADPAPNVAYLARPCQFTPMASNPRCGIAWWTGRRFAPAVVASIDDAVSRLAARTPGQPINLTGYSGGAAIAVLVAARRTDVASIRTVAGNLDDAFVNRLHHVSPMPESLNPIDYAARVAAIPQLHFASADDEVVPPDVARRFVDSADATGLHCAQMQVVSGLTHDGDWARRWPALLRLTPTCSTSHAIASSGSAQASRPRAQ